MVALRYPPIESPLTCLFFQDHNKEKNLEDLALDFQISHDQDVFHASKLVALEAHGMTAESLRKNGKIDTFNQFKLAFGDRVWYLLKDSPYMFAPKEKLYENLYIPFATVANKANKGILGPIQSVSWVRISSVMSENDFTEP
jgi:hypothetical protein